MSPFTIALILLMACLFWLACVIVPLAYWWRERKRLAEIKKKYAPIVSVEAEVARLQSSTGQIKKEAEAEVARLQSSAEQIRKETADIQTQYAEKRWTLRKLEGQVAMYDERLAFVEMGIYEPHFDFGDSEAYKANIRSVREQQKASVALKTAIIATGDWTLHGSESKGQTMINRQIRLTLRAFNNECEAAIANTRWNNVVAMGKRIRNAAKQINKANASLLLEISGDYVALRLRELHLTHEYRERLKVEKQIRADATRADRDEIKLLAETNAAEKEEQKYAALLQSVRNEAGADEARIADLEAALAEAQATGNRARAMAQMTKSGYIYIISNIGSFGDNVVKIGLTRRLDPEDRVRELGDASVPFRFDTHAMIYSEEAPALEAALHKEFSDRRVNASNLRKEFFRVSLDEVEDAVSRLAPLASFFKDREAQEWHETLALRKQALVDMQRPSDNLPEKI